MPKSFVRSMLSEEGNSEYSSKRSIAVFLVLLMAVQMFLCSTGQMTAPPEFMFENITYIVIGALFGTSAEAIMKFRRKTPAPPETEIHIENNNSPTQ